MDLGYFDLNKNFYSVSHFVLLTEFGKYDIPETPTERCMTVWKMGFRKIFETGKMCVVGFCNSLIFIPLVFSSCFRDVSGRIQCVCLLRLQIAPC